MKKVKIKQFGLLKLMAYSRDETKKPNVLFNILMHLHARFACIFSMCRGVGCWLLELKIL